MNWWLIFGGILLYAVVQTAVLVWWLWRRGRSLVVELGVLGERTEQLADILGQVDAAPRATPDRLD